MSLSILLWKSLRNIGVNSFSVFVSVQLFVFLFLSSLDDIFLLLFRESKRKVEREKHQLVDICVP